MLIGVIIALLLFAFCLVLYCAAAVTTEIDERADEEGWEEFLGEGGE